MNSHVHSCTRPLLSVCRRRPLGRARRGRVPRGGRGRDVRTRELRSALRGGAARTARDRDRNRNDGGGIVVVVIGFSVGLFRS